jgi:hypothetical protein
MASMAWFGDEGPPTITDYRVEDDREYSVMLSSERDKDDPWASTSHAAGTAKAGGTPGAFWVEFESTDPNPRFYSVWRVDKSGVANLSEILLSTGPYKLLFASTWSQPRTTGGIDKRDMGYPPGG